MGRLLSFAVASLMNDRAAENSSNPDVGLRSNIMGAEAAMASRKNRTLSISMSFSPAEIDARSTNTGISVLSRKKGQIKNQKMKHIAEEFHV